MAIKKTTRRPIKSGVYDAFAAYNDALDEAVERLEVLERVPYFKSRVTGTAMNMIKLARAMVAHDCTLALASREAKNAGYYDTAVLRDARCKAKKMA